MFVFPDQSFDRPNLAVVQAVILRQFNLRLNPELRLAICVVHMHVEPGFLAREEKEPEAVFAKDRRAQGLRLSLATNVGANRRAPIAPA